MVDIKILIVDDEVLIAEDLKDILNSFDLHQIYLAHSKSEAIKLLDDVKPDLVLLDIRMERELDGLEIGGYINNKIHIPFIYITAHSDMAMIKEIVKTKPAAYITKPFKKSDLFASINLVRSNINSNQPKNVIIKDGYDSIIIPSDNIYYIESEGNYINIFLDNKKLVSRQSLDSFMEQLEQVPFFRIHRSYIVNISKLTRYSKKEVEINGVVLPVSRSAADDFETAIKNIRG